jgi:hypothetical protein
MSHSHNIFFLLLVLVAAGLSAAEGQKDATASGGQFIELSKDGLPWAHPHTSLRMPQTLGGFKLEKVFKADRVEAGYAVTYTEERRGLRMDWLIYPPEAQITDPSRMLSTMKLRMDQTVSGLMSLAKGGGYYEASRSPVEEVKLAVWKRDGIPMLTQSFVMKAAQGPVREPKPDLLNTLNLLLFEDYYVQSSLMMPATLGEEAKQVRDEVDKLFAGLVREPFLTQEYLGLAVKYVEKPMDLEGQKSADALLQLAEASLTMKPHFPGEGITPCLREAEKTAPGCEKDLLRAFGIGSLVVKLQDGSFDDQMTEGARMMSQVFEMLKGKHPALKSEACEGVAAAVKEGKAALYLRERMLAPVTP